MADVNRLQVDTLVLHHAVTPMWKGYSKAWIAQWFSDNGFARGYGSNPANWSGLINPYTGARSYAQAQYAGQYVTQETPDATDAERLAGFRLVQLVKDPWGQICWHAGNWEVNRASIGIENLGDFRNYTLSDKACRVIADFWRPQDKRLSGATAIFGHKEVTLTSTACPARIMEVRDKIVGYVNKPPQPPQPAKPVWVDMQNPRKLRTKSSVYVVNLPTGANVGNPIGAGTEIEFTTKTMWNNKEWVRSKYSSEAGADNAIEFSKLEEIDPPKVEVRTEVTTETLPFATIIVEDETIPEGEQRIDPVGSKGVRTITYKVTYTDGKETAREVVSDIIEQPVAEVIRVGTYVAPDPIDPDPTDPEDPLEPIDGETALEWLKRLWGSIIEWLSKFVFKK
jgi:hypothetical protein